MRRTVAVVVLGACGRIGFEPMASPSGGPTIDGFDAPAACVEAIAPTSCSVTSTRVTALGASTFHMCAIRGSGLTCWGDNSYGQLGLCTDTAEADVPTDTLALPAVQLAIGELHMCVRLTNDQVWCWGSRFEGESGDGISTEGSPIPRRIGGTWRDIATLRYTTCGVGSDGSLWCWGHNLEGQLGLGDVVDRGTPQRVGTDADWARVWVGGYMVCAQKIGGAMYCWGENVNGEVGDGTMMQRLVPTPMIGGVPFRSLSLGWRHACGLTAIGEMWCWGLNASGELGIGSIMDASHPAQVMGGPYMAASVGCFHTCALDMAGALSCWGDNSEQTITNQAASYYASPFVIDAGPWVEVETGCYTTCVRKADSSVQCYGRNAQGQLGIGSTQLQSTLQPVCFGN